MNLKAGTHYDVIRYEGGGFDGQVRLLRCKACAFAVPVRALHRTGDRSGQGRYNRARAAMVKHIHAAFNGLGAPERDLQK